MTKAGFYISVACTPYSCMSYTLRRLYVNVFTVLTQRAVNERINFFRPARAVSACSGSNAFFLISHDFAHTYSDSDTCPRRHGVVAGDQAGGI